MKNRLIILVFTLMVGFDSLTNVRCVLSKIPDYLTKCYENGEMVYHAPKTVQLLVDLIDKVEVNNFNYNLRTLSTALLHNLRLDGIEKAHGVKETESVLPYQARAFQFHKFNLLLDLIPDENIGEFWNNLDRAQLCTLHHLISSRVDKWERGDEYKTCPESEKVTEYFSGGSLVQRKYNATSRNSNPAPSRCPKENGVIYTAWGDISPGTLIAAIAAALEPQSVKLKDLYRSDEANLMLFRNREFVDDLISTVKESEELISNVYAATLTGDLAEAAIKRGPIYGNRFTEYNIGTTGIWNDSILPRNLYLYLLVSPGEWEMTDAELLGGIDGFIIAHHIHDWMTKIENIRLSQIIEMYYSNYGMSFDHNIRACDRRTNFNKLLKTEELYQQTENMVKILSLTLSEVSMTPEALKGVSDAAVQAFLNYWPRKMDDLPGCDVRGDTSPMEITLVTDGSWPKYEIEQLVATITRTLDVSDHGSTLGLVHGRNGDWISLHSNSTLTIYNNIANYTKEWPTKLELSTVLTSILKYLTNSTQAEILENRVISLPRVVVVAAPSSKLTDYDMKRSKTIMRSLRDTFTDVYFLFMMPDEDAFKQLAIHDQKYSDTFIETSNTDERGMAEIIRSNFIEKAIPKRFIPPYCNNPKNKAVRYQYEDYIMVGQRNIYKIHPLHMENVAALNIHFQGTDMGEISVCISRNDTEKDAVSCKIIAGLNYAPFKVRHPCDSELHCNPVYFIVKARSTLIKCADKSCRYPDQIRYIIRHEGLRCLGNNSESKASTLQSNNLFIKTTAVLSLILYLLKT